MNKARPYFILGATLALSLGFEGCLYQGAAQTISERELAEAESMDRVPDFPLVRQSGEQDCGAAALAATLQHWGTPLGIDDVRRIVGIEDEPIRADRLRDIARDHGYDAFLVRGTFADLRHEVHAGRPVVVGMLKPYVGDQWFAHYEVVTAIGASHLVTMDPAEGFRRYPLAGFEREWRPTGRLTMIVAPRWSRD